MPAGITAQFGFLYQRYAYIKLALENAGMDRFFVYEGLDDIDISEEHRISAVRENNNQFVQVKSGTVTKDCWAKVLGNWLLIDEKTPTYKIILEHPLAFDYNNDDVIKSVLDYFTKGADQKSTSIAYRVYKKYIERFDEATLKSAITEILDRVFFEEASMKQLNASIKEIFNATYCSDIKEYEMAKNCRCERFIEYINAEIDEAIKKKNSYTLRYVDFMKIINKVTAEISDQKYIIDITEMKKSKKAKAEQLVSSNDLREVRQLRLVNVDKGFIVNELVKELLYRDFRDVYISSDRTLISNIEETAYSNFEDVKFNLSKDAKPRQVFHETIAKVIPLTIVDNSPLYRNGCYVYLTCADADESKQITWGEEHE